MITHFAQLQLPTVSIQGVKQFYQDQLHFPVISESENEISFQPTEFFTLTFRETEFALHPAHFAFEVPCSEFDDLVSELRSSSVTLLKWPDGRIIDHFGTGGNVYFRDGDGNLLEMIAHPYVKEGILPTQGDLKILYLREIGFPVDDVAEFRELLVHLFDFKLDKVSENFSFAIGGTAHAVISSTKRKWIPIAMTALQPAAMVVTFGVSSMGFMQEIKAKLDRNGIPNEWKDEDQLYFQINVYHFYLKLTNFLEDVPVRLNLPFSIK